MEYPDEKGSVYLVTQEDLSAGRSTLEIVDAAIRGGVDVIQLREKEMSARAQYELGRQVRERTAMADVLFIVNDRVDLAQAVDADGVHLGENDLPVHVARDQLGDTAIIGRSVSNEAAAERAAESGADYLGVGAVYQTSSKNTPPEETDIGLDTIRAIRDATEIPFVGIGGIDTTNAADVVAAGANGVAVISAITAADDPERATQQLSEAVENGWIAR